MSSSVKLLFICSQNRWRSLTAEQIFQDLPGYQVRSAGTSPVARIRVSEGHIGWADLIFVMEKKHAEILRDKFDDALSGKKIVCLHIPDDYQYMDQRLIELLKAGVSPYISIAD